MRGLENFVEGKQRGRVRVRRIQRRFWIYVCNHCGNSAKLPHYSRNVICGNCRQQYAEIKREKV